MSRPQAVSSERAAEKPVKKRLWKDTIRPYLIGVLAFFLVFVVRRFPVFLVEPFGLLVAKVVARVAKKERRILYQNIEHVLGLPSHSSFAQEFARQVVRHQVFATLETLMSVYRPELLTVEGTGELREKMTNLESHSKGQIVITAHIGSWELCGRFCAQAANRDLFALAKPSKSKEVTKLLDDMRAKMGMNILWTDQKSLFRDMIRVLKEHNWLSFVMDQKPEGRVGPVVHFYGRPTEFVSGPASMAIKFNVPLLAAFCVREAPFRYRLIATEVIPSEHGIEDEVVLTQKIANEIERVIRIYPEQWCWNYKRWRLEEHPELSKSPN